MASVRKVRRKKSARSIYDVARKARVSVFTVSAVVNHKSHVREKLRKRVEAAIHELNYRPNLIARSLANQRTHTIGMIVPDIGNPFFPMVVRGAEDAAQRHGYNLLLCNSDDSLEKEEAAVELLLAKRVDGILLTKAGGDFRPGLRQMIKDVNIPFVLVMRTYPKTHQRCRHHRRLSGRLRCRLPPRAFPPPSHRPDRRPAKSKQRPGPAGMDFTMR